jgi:chromosomal replication initiation ATPase DnaA
VLSFLHEIWSKLQPRLRSQVGEAAYVAWIEGLRPLALERSVCYLEANSRMACDRVQRLFQPLIEDLLGAEIGTRVSVNVLPAPESQGPDQLEVGPSQPLVDAGNKTAVLVLTALIDVEKRSALPSQQVLLYGPLGVGKTFLLRWFVGGLARRPSFFTGEELVRTYQATFREHRAGRFTQELIEAPTLCLDEMHRINGAERVQHELVTILQARAEASRPTVVASRWHPRDIWKLSPVLESVLLAGFVAAIEYPGLDARLRYLRALEGPASRNGLATVVEELAREVHGGYRDVRRAWLAQRNGAPPELRARYLQLVEPRSLFERQLNRISERIGVPGAEVLGRSQSRTASFARQVVAHVCVLEGLSRAEVGRFLGGRSRAAISYSIKALQERMTKSEKIRRRVEELLA